MHCYLASQSSFISSVIQSTIQSVGALFQLLKADSWGKKDMGWENKKEVAFV